MKARDSYHDEDDIIDYDLDYESCVMNNHPECQYETGSSTNAFTGHQGLIQQFCGSDAVSNNDFPKINLKNFKTSYFLFIVLAYRFCKIIVIIFSRFVNG